MTLSKKIRSEPYTLLFFSREINMYINEGEHYKKTTKEIFDYDYFGFSMQGCWRSCYY